MRKLRRVNDIGAPPVDTSVSKSVTRETKASILKRNDGARRLSLLRQTLLDSVFVLRHFVRFHLRKMKSRGYLETRVQLDDAR